MKLLLDTCSFLWIVLDSAELTRTARAAFVDPTNDVFLSSASAWEIVIKHTRGKLALPVPPMRFVSEQKAQHRIHSLAIDETAALGVARLPEIHADPFDRILISQAIMGGLTLLTPDPEISKYPVPTLW